LGLGAAGGVSHSEHTAFRQRSAPVRSEGVGPAVRAERGRCWCYETLVVRRMQEPFIVSAGRRPSSSKRSA
jgi:hypothetical protein